MTTLIKGRFLLLGEPSRPGGLSEVRKAVDTLSAAGDFVAIKLLRRLDDDAVIEIFLERETETLGTLSHPNIVRLLGSGWSTEMDRYFMALEWVDRSLKDELDTGRLFTWDSYFNAIAKPLVSALSHAHAREIEHRDIKPGNVLLGSDGVMKLADFGIAKIRSKVSHPEHTVAEFRSGLYAPPELEDTIPYVRDVFAYGVLAVQVLSGSKAQDYSDLASILDSVQGIPHEFRSILQSCVALDPGDRPANAAVLEQRLLEAEQICSDRNSRKTSALWMRLTRGAATSVLGYPADVQDDFLRAKAAVLDDLGGAVHAEYGYDRRTSEVDKSTITLVGRSFKVKVKPDEGYAERVVIVQAATTDEGWLGGWRERACAVGQTLTWTFDDPGEAAAFRGRDALLDRLDEHLERKRESGQARDTANKLGDLFEGWRRLLEAREEIARGQRKPIPYESISRKGRTVTFHLSQPHEVSVLGEDWEVAESVLGRPLERGEVVEQVDDAIGIRFRRADVRPPRAGVLVPYLGPSKTALQRQYDALANIGAGQTANPLLRDVIEDPASLAVGTPAEISTWMREDLDPSKRDVVRHALGSQDLLLVEGPPGTGKTTVIAEIVQQTLRRSPRARILIVSQTHIAIDNALHRLEEAGIAGLIRLGRPDDPRVATNAQHLLLDKQMKRWSRDVRSRAGAYLEGLARRHGLDARHLRAALTLEELATIMANIGQVRAHIAAISAEPAPEKTAAARSLAEEIVTARTRLDELAEAKDELFLQAQQSLAGDLTLRKDHTVQEARAAVEALVGVTPAGKQLMLLLRLQGEWLQRIDTDPNLVAAFLKTRNVVGGTALGFLGHAAVRDLEFDLCIFDEASKATATEAMVPLARAKRWILIGDTRQLPPMDEDILRDERVMEEHQLTPEVVRTTLFQYLTDRTEHPVRHLLREQYRMIPAIGNLISTVFYKEQLVSPSRKVLPGYGDMNKPVLWVNTYRLGKERRESDRGVDRSIANRTEAHQVKRRLETLDRAIGHGLIKPSDGKLDVLLIAPYGRQVDELRRKLASTRLQYMNPEVLSVDAVQGRECDLAIFSVTRSNDLGKFGFLGEAYWRRINVALSRARFGLIIVGDAEFCRSKPGALRDVLHYIDEHRQECEIRDAERI